MNDILPELEKTIQLINGDCLEVMKTLPDKSIDLILADLPFALTQNSWDQMIPLDKLWEQYKRLIKLNSPIVLMGIQPFSSMLIASNLKMFKYELIWKKNIKTGFLNAKKAPLRAHESILVFYDKQPVYNPQKTTGHAPVHSYAKKATVKGIDANNYGEVGEFIGGGSTERYPTSIIEIPVIPRTSKERFGHPTEKPVALAEYLIKTYSNEGMTVMDNTMGVGTTGVACKNLNRKFIGIEIETKFFDITKSRLFP